MTPGKTTPDRRSIVPYRGRPPRGMLLWAVPLLVVSVAMALSFLFYGGYGVITMVGLGAVGTLYYGRVVSILLRGHTEADSKGITFQLHGNRRELRWKNVKELKVLRTTFGRRLAVVQKNGAAGVAMLPAPRTGLFGRTPDFDEAVEELRSRCSGKRIEVQEQRSGVKGAYVGLIAFALCLQFAEFPWQETWWPTNRDATALPQACRVVDDATVKGLVPQAAMDDRYHDDKDPFQTSGCHWGVAGTKDGVEVRLQRYSREGGNGGTSNARDRMMTFSRVYLSESVRGLGEEAWRITEPSGAVAATTGDGTRRVQIMARQRNVVVLVDYTARGLAEQRMEDAAADLARRALGQVKFG